MTRAGPPFARRWKMVTPHAVVSDGTGLGLVIPSGLGLSPLNGFPHPRPADPVVGPDVETRFEVGVSRGRVYFDHKPLGKPGPPVPCGQSRPSWSLRTPYDCPVCPAQDFS